MSTSGWVGVDLDGTLAQYDGWKGVDHIGDPVPKMLERVRNWLADGVTVKIFTARVFLAPECVTIIQDWCEKHGLPRLEVTNVKDFTMVELWDDRCYRVKMNTGELYNTIYKYKPEPTCVQIPESMPMC